MDNPVVGTLMGSVVILILLFALHKLKALFIAGSMVVQREIESGEAVTFHLNIYVFDSQMSVFNRIMKFAETGIKRKTFCFERYQAILNEGNDNVSPMKKGGA